MTPTDDGPRYLRMGQTFDTTEAAALVHGTTPPDVAALATRLRAWAQDYRAAKAAVEFLILTGQVRRAASCGLVITEAEHDRVVSYINPDPDDPWRPAAGAYSSGERAVLDVAASLHHGELCDALLSMDGTNRGAFVAAIVAGFRG